MGSIGISNVPNYGSYALGQFGQIKTSQDKLRSFMESMVDKQNRAIEMNSFNPLAFAAVASTATTVPTNYSELVSGIDEKMKPFIRNVSMADGGTGILFVDSSVKLAEGQVKVDTSQYGLASLIRTAQTSGNWDKVDIYVKTLQNKTLLNKNGLLPWAISVAANGNASILKKDSASDGSQLFLENLSTIYILAILRNDKTRMTDYGKLLSTFYDRFIDNETFTDSLGKVRLKPGDNWVDGSTELFRNVVNLSYYYGRGLINMMILAEMGLISTQHDAATTAHDLFSDYHEQLIAGESIVKGKSVGIFSDFQSRDGKPLVQYGTGGFDAIRVLPNMGNTVAYVNLLRSFGVVLDQSESAAGAAENQALFQQALNQVLGANTSDAVNEGVIDNFIKTAKQVMLNRYNFFLTQSSMGTGTPENIQKFFKDTSYFWGTNGVKIYDWINSLSTVEFPATMQTVFPEMSSVIQQLSMSLMQSEITEDAAYLYNLGYSAFGLHATTY